MSFMFKLSMTILIVITLLTIGACSSAPPRVFDCTKEEVVIWHKQNTAVFSKSPIYPKSSLHAGETGTVKVSLLFSSNDSLIEPSIVESSGYPALDNAALTLFKERSFTPPICGGRRSWVRIVMPIAFKIED